MMKLQKKIFISGLITAKTGLHIGSNSMGLSIGNTDNTVLRDPITNYPYVPGSSIRGKMRSLLERLEGKFTVIEGSDIQFGPYTKDPEDIICKVFGVPVNEKKDEEKDKEKDKKRMVSSRLLVRDGHLQNPEALKEARETDMPYTEVKTEVVIDRVTSKAMPRQLERVPAGSVFNLELILNVWEKTKDEGESDNEKEMLDLVFQGLSLMQNDYLGGHGGRGSGQVEIHIASVKEKTAGNYQKNEAAVPKKDVEIPAELQNPSKSDAHAASETAKSA